MPTRTRSRSTLGRVLDYMRAEPVAFQGVVQATVALLVGFGILSWTAEQTGLTLALTAALLSLVARRKVSPNAKNPAA